MNLENDSTVKIEREIDAALKKLRDTQPPPAMLSRIQQSLETAAITPQQARSGRLFWIPVTSAALMAVLFVIVLQRHLTGGKQASPSAPAKMAVNMPATAGNAATVPTLAPAVSSGRRKPSSQSAVVRRRRERPHYRHAANLFSYPLTRQEKLLVRFAQTAAPKDLQALNPEYQAKVEAQQETDFAAYLKSGSSWSYNGTTENTPE